MHKSAYNHMKNCVDQFLVKDKKYTVLDFGSRVSSEGHTTHKTLFESSQYTYLGCDVQNGINVDLVMEKPYTVPLENESMDVIISGQVLEHVPYFWVSFLELARVLKVDGYIFLAVPSRGHIHSHPNYDCWRFYPDAYKALASFAGLRLVQADTDFPPKLPNKRLDYANIPSSQYWGDTIGVFQKTEAYNQAELTSMLNILQDRANKVADLDASLSKFGVPEIQKNLTIKHTKYDITFPFDPNIFVDKVVKKMDSGRYESKEATAALKYIKPNQRVLELGGGLGFMSTLIKSRLNPASYTVVEADPRLVPIIKKTHLLNGADNMLVMNCVATSDPIALNKGYCELGIGATFWGSSVKTENTKRKTIKVDTIPLKGLLDNVKPEVLLLDIEGGEEDLFDGLDMPTINLIIIEFHPNVIGEDGVRKIENEFARNGLLPEIFEKSSSVFVGIYSRRN